MISSMASHKDKTFKLLSDNNLTTPLEEYNTPIDWNLCVFCEKDTSEKLQCPTEFTERFRGDGYATIAENLKSFNDLGCLPVNIKLTRLDDGDGIQQALLQRKAKFHKSCRLKFNKNELQRASKRKRLLDNESTSSGSNRHCKCQKNSGTKTKVAKCFLCDKPASTARPLHELQTFDLDARVQQCATDLQDDRLLMKLSEGDLIATEAKYHAQCLESLYNRQRDKKGTSEGECDTNNAHSTAFAELIAFMQCSHAEEGISPVFKLSVLKKMYSDRVSELGGQSSEVHSTRLKNRILIYFPGMQAYSEGRELLLALNKDVGKSIITSCKLENDNEAVLTSRVANIIRRDFCKSKDFPFNNSFTQDCQENSVPHSLCMLLAMIMNGTTIKEQGMYLSQTVLSLSQLIKFNSSANRHQEGTRATRHVGGRETPLPLFVGALLHSRTRSRDLVETFHKLGLSVTYDCVLDMSADLGNSAINHFENTGAPSELTHATFISARNRCSAKLRRARSSFRKRKIDKLNSSPTEKMFLVLIQKNLQQLL